MSNKVTFLNITFDRMKPSEAVETLLTTLLSRQGQRIYYANAHTIVTALQTPELVEALNNCDRLLADGSGVRWGSALVGSGLTYNLNGTDLVPALCQAGQSEGLTVYLLGGRPGVAEEAAANLQKACPDLQIVGTRHGYFEPSGTAAILEDIRQARPHLLLVALGVPYQEIWINRHADLLPGISCMGVGGLFDFLAHRVPRAPRLVRAAGMEWAWRLMMEPTRLGKRYIIGNLVFVRLVFKALFAPYAPPPPPVPVSPLLNVAGPVLLSSDGSSYSEARSA